MCARPPAKWDNAWVVGLNLNSIAKEPCQVGINSRDLWRVHCGRWSARGNSLGVVNMQNITAVAMCTLFSAFAELEKVVRGVLLLLLLLLSGVRTNEGALAWQKLKTPKGNCAREDSAERREKGCWICKWKCHNSSRGSNDGSRRRMRLSWATSIVADGNENKMCEGCLCAVYGAYALLL